jgi:protein-tyrosine phosphatase
MLDLHCHILPGVDDGPQTLDGSLAVARFFVADGITHCTATPHCHEHLRLLRATIVPHVVRFNEELAKAGIALTVLPGSEIQLTDPAAYRRDYLAGVFCHLGGGKRFTLMEFPWHEQQYPAKAAEHVKWLMQQGTRPILAHPERHNYFRDDPDRLNDLVEAGGWVQVTVDSLLGRFGPIAQRAGEEVLDAYPEALLASDTHGGDRCSGLSAGYEFVTKRFGEARAEDLRGRAEWILAELLREQAA